MNLRDLRSLPLAVLLGLGLVVGVIIAAILLSNVFERYSWKYANRGYRYALIDSGHIGENLRLAARSASPGWPSSPTESRCRRIGFDISSLSNSESPFAATRVGRAFGVLSHFSHKAAL